jgi:hypothetical protein
MSDAVCADPSAPHCGDVLDAFPAPSIVTCGACADNGDCTDPMAPNCSPAPLLLGEFGGSLACVPDASVPDGGACNLAEEGGVPIGHAACASGKCGEAHFMGIFEVGVCGECLTDADCEPGETCETPSVDPDTLELVGAKCM